MLRKSFKYKNTESPAGNRKRRAGYREGVGVGGGYHSPALGRGTTVLTGCARVLARSPLAGTGAPQRGPGTQNWPAYAGGNDA